MRKTAYIVHGCCEEDEYLSNDRPSPSNCDWIPWLQKQLLIKGYLCQTPEMPKPHQPNYAEWKAMLDCYPIDRQTTLVAHSCGCGFALRWLEDTGTSIERLVLVAPWLDFGKTRGKFLDFDLDPRLSAQWKFLHLIHGRDDKHDQVRQAVELLTNAFPAAQVQLLESGGHFSFKELSTSAFPAVLSTIP